MTPVQLVADAQTLGLHAIALADHDSVEGVQTALDAGRRVGLIVVPAVELTASTEDGRDMHILGYRVDHRDPRFKERLAVLRELRHGRAVAMIEALRGAGYGLDVSDVMHLAGGGAVGRAHIARALEAKGHVASTGDAFRELIGRDKPFYVKKSASSPEEIIALVRSACGLAVLAHPGVTRVDDLLGRLQSAGLQGIEVWHSEHKPADVKRYLEIARRRGLLATGGSDYHGPSSSGGGKRMGIPEVSDAVLEELYAVERGPAL